MAHSDMPPTPADVKMRSRHTAESVKYNLGHLKDHVGNMNDSLTTLSTVDKPKANNLAHTMSGQIHKLADKIKGDNMATPTKKTGSPALAAYMGRKKYGSKAMASIVAKGRK